MQNGDVKHMSKPLQVLFLILFAWPFLLLFIPKSCPPLDFGQDSFKAQFMLGYYSYRKTKFSLQTDEFAI